MGMHVILVMCKQSFKLQCAYSASAFLLHFTKQCGRQLLEFSNDSSSHLQAVIDIPVVLT